MSKTILVTGASGSLGRAIVSALAAAGLEVKQAVRNLAKAAPGVDAVRWDYTEPVTFAPALAGVNGLLLISPSLDPDAAAKLGPAIVQAKAAGAGQIVFISAFGVNHSEQAPLRVVEHLVMDSGVPYTILRPNFFMENFSSGFLASTIKNMGAIFLAADKAKTSFISTRDIAATVVAAFEKPLTGVELDLTGPEPLDHEQVSAMISEAAGRTIPYRPLSEEQMVAGARFTGMPEPAVSYLTMLYSVVRSGYMEPVTQEFERVVGRPPITFREFAQANAEAWK